MSKRAPDNGFTLIELMIVLAIIGIIASLVFNVSGSIMRQGPEYDRIQCEASGGTYSRVNRYGVPTESLCTYNKKD